MNEEVILWARRSMGRSGRRRGRVCEMKGWIIIFSNKQLLTHIGSSQDINLWPFTSKLDTTRETSSRLINRCFFMNWHDAVIGDQQFNQLYAYVCRTNTSVYTHSWKTCYKISMPSVLNHIFYSLVVLCRIKYQRANYLKLWVAHFDHWNYVIR